MKLSKKIVRIALVVPFIMSVSAFAQAGSTLDASTTITLEDALNQKMQMDGTVGQLSQEELDALYRGACDIPFAGVAACIADCKLLVGAKSGYCEPRKENGETVKICVCVH